MSWFYIFFRTAIVAALCSMVIELTEQREIKGMATVIDGDTIEINNQKIKLFGIDAPELEQFCYIKSQPWHCGKIATEALQAKIEQKHLICLTKNRTIDQMLAAECFVDQQNLNSWLVGEGLAIADRRFSQDFVPHEIIAKKKNLGIYQSNFLQPWLWRKINHYQ